MSKAVYFKDAGSRIEFPEWLRGLAFADESWHNDACPKAVRELTDGRHLVVWVAEDRAADRELTSMKKFTVTVETLDQSAAPRVVGEGDDWRNAHAMVQAVLAADGVADPRLRRHALDAILMEWGSVGQQRALEHFYRTVQARVSKAGWRGAEDYLLKALDYEGVLYACELMAREFAKKEGKGH
jgi:hypothetical protein